jgi:glycosyltransferase involved in cell wall biosynthesis
MHVLFAVAQPYLPQMRGPCQVNLHDLAQALISYGDTVTIISPLKRSDTFGLMRRLLMRLSGRTFTSDRRLGYRVYRYQSLREGVGQIVPLEQPDVIVVKSCQPALTALTFVPYGVPLVVILQSRSIENSPEIKRLGSAHFLARSQYTARQYSAKYGIDCKVVPPLVRRARYSPQGRRCVAVFVSSRPFSGTELALATAARCQEIPFVFIDLAKYERPSSALIGAVEGLANARLVTGADTLEILGKARMVVAPGEWQDVLARVIAEAQYNGVPVIATKAGGFPEAVGPGGILIEGNGVLDRWVEAIRRLWMDDDYFRSLSRQAIENRRRPELDREVLVARFRMALAAAIADSASHVPGSASP